MPLTELPANKGELPARPPAPTVFTAAPDESSPPTADRSPMTFPHALQAYGPALTPRGKLTPPRPCGLTHQVTLSDRRLSGDGQRMAPPLRTARPPKGGVTTPPGGSATNPLPSAGTRQ